ncbi:uncharacterized protein LOC135120437 [Zophobas morio]|uniref:uncharacterized protein LOC135120437 n=1 Tax=Zophobas morio TaxID=2755281 RepID=UPI0030839D0B
MNWTRLKVLDLCVSLPELSNLKHLEIDGLNFSDKYLRVILSRLPHLRHFSNAFNISLLDFTALNDTTLFSLNLSNTYFPQKNCSLPVTLKFLDLSYTRVGKDDLFSILKRCVSLEKIILFGTEVASERLDALSQTFHLDIVVSER